ncbi:hypothetical protein Dimus_017796 [Dionaea muscipula]
MTHALHTQLDSSDSLDRLAGANNRVFYPVISFIADDSGDDDNDDDNDGNDGDHLTAPEQAQTSSINATEVIDDVDDDKEDDVIESASQEAQRDGKEAIDEDDDLPLSSKIEALRSKEAVDDDDDVLLSIKYQPTSQDLILANVDLEIASVNNKDMEVDEPAVLESKFEDNSLVYFGADG